MKNAEKEDWMTLGNQVAVRDNEGKQDSKVSFPGLGPGWLQE